MMWDIQTEHGTTSRGPLCDGYTDSMGPRVGGLCVMWDIQTAWDRESGAAGYASVLIIILYLSVLYLTQYGGTLVSQFEAFFSLSGM